MAATKRSSRPVIALGLLRGSLAGQPSVSQIPDWYLLDQSRAAGLNDRVIHWIAAPNYGVLGNEIPAVMGLLAGKA